MLPTIATGNVASALPTGYNVDNSVRLDGNAYLHKTQSGGNRKTWTISCWTKLTGGYGSNGGMLMACDGLNDNTNFLFGIDNGGHSGSATDTLSLHIYGADGFRTTPLLRDYSAWYHVVLASDNTQATSTNRLKLYVNNVQITLSEQGDYPAENQDVGVNNSGTVIGVGTHPGSIATYALNSYLAEYCLIDGLQLTPSSFGEYDEDSPTIWKPIDVSGLTFGTKGFYLDFKDSANLGNDANGGTDLTEVSLDATDQSTDTPTNNFCVMNRLEPWSNPNNFSQGNCMLSGPAGSWQLSRGSMGFSKGKWFWEVRYEGGTVGNYHSGVSDETANNFVGTHNQAGCTTLYNGDSGEMYYGSADSFTSADYGSINTSSDVLGVACNFDDGVISYYINGSIIITNYALDSTTNNKNTLFPSSVKHGSSQVTKYNFGGSPAFTVSSGKTDGAGY